MKTKIEKPNLFLKPRMAFLLINLNASRGYYPKLYRDIGCTAITINEAIKKFKNSGLITVSKVGRSRVIKLTSKGKRLVEILIRMKKLTDKNV